MNFLKLLLLSGVMILGFVENSISQDRCITTDQWHQQQMIDNPDYNRHILNIERKAQQVLDDGALASNPNCSAGRIIIPVAVHYAAAGSLPTTAAEQACAINIVLDQIATLNDEFNGLDPDAANFNANLASCFPTTLGISCVEFCLATQNHPTGYGLSNGDYAVTFGQINFNALNPGSFSVPKDPNWAGYLNIFVDNFGGGLLGESAGIPGNFSGEGVTVSACYFGTGNVTCTGFNSTASCSGNTYDEGNTLGHEVGHYLGLRHIWGDGGCGASDQIADTPAMSGAYDGYTNCNDVTCGQLPTSCGSPDMYMSYMSYAGDGCMYMFSSDQADRMYSVAVASGFTTSTPSVCTAACVITDVNLTKTCFDNGTPSDPSDDYFTFDVDPVGTGVGTTYTVSITGGTAVTGLAYGSPNTIDNGGAGFPISAGGFTISVKDDANPSCNKNALVTSTSTCSTAPPCALSSINASTTCNANGTNSTAADDFYTITINPSGTSLTGTYSISGAVSVSGVSYGSNYTITNSGAGFPISSGSVTITVTDDTDPTCTLTQTVNAPATCSSASNPCPSTLTLTGTESGTIDNEATWIESDELILSGASVDYDAVDYVLMKNNFQVDAGALFEAFIDGCNGGSGGVNLRNEDDVKK